MVAAATAAAAPQPAVSPGGDAKEEPVNGHFGTTGFQHASIFSKFTYSFDPLIKLGWVKKVNEVSWFESCLLS